MMEIEMPKIAVEENEERSYAKIVVEPLEKGFGLTIGNCLRRILLSALPGAAITNVKFAEGVKHEFTAIPHIKEDVTEIILNLKCIAIKTASIDKNFKKNVKLFKEGPAGKGPRWLPRGTSPATRRSKSSIPISTSARWMTAPFSIWN